MSESSTVPRTYWSIALIPVQSWISEARRSRDLLAGSRTLAWLMGDLLSALNDGGAKLLLPRLDDDDLKSLRGTFADALTAGTTAVSNRASGWLPLEGEQARPFFEELEHRLERRWITLVREVSGAASRTARSLWNEIGRWVGTPDCPFNLVWAAGELAGGDAKALAEIDRLLDAVKRSRPSRLHHGAPVRKCGQCGRREALGGPDPVAWHQFQEHLAGLKEVVQGLRFDAREYLCPHCALRRFAGYLREDRFPSTSEIAAREWLWAIRSCEDLRSALRALHKAMERVPGYEHRWADRAPLYYRRSAERKLRKAQRSGDAESEPALRDVLTLQRALDKEIERHNRKPGNRALPLSPGEYLAVLVFDGDDMGRRLREDLERLPQGIRDFQNQLAARLTSSSEVDREGVQDADPVFSLAEPFYLGGDEGLVLAPAGAGLKLATAIRQLWSETVTSDVQPAPTLSMGVTIFDRERPVGSAIETAHQAIEAAKQFPGKDAMTVSVQTASGSAWSVTGRWREEWARLRDAVSLLKAGTLASGWSYDVEAFLRTLQREAFTSGEPTRRAIREEVKRLTFRRVVASEADHLEATAEGRKTAVWNRLAGETWWESEPPEALLEAQPEQLHLVAFLARQAGR